MKQFLLHIIFALVLAGQAFGQAEATLVKSLPTNGLTATIELPGEVSSSEWDKDYIRVTINIKAENTTEQILKRLVSIGRYELQNSDKEGEISISMPKIAHLVTIKGVDLIERFSFEVQLPKGMKAVIKAPETLTTSTL
jgi:hypothetical protein